MSFPIEHLAFISGLVQSVPEPFRLLLLGIAFLWGGATLRRTLQVDAHVETDSLIVDEWTSEVKISGFKLRPSETKIEVFGD